MKLILNYLNKINIYKNCKNRSKTHLETIKVQKLIANSGLCSRRKAEKLIKTGKVKCNGHIAKIGDRVFLNCKIEVTGKTIDTNSIKKIYLILNKPTGYISTMHDEFNRKTAYSLVKSKLRNRVFLVGRLDYNSQGLMLFTNDGELAYKISHPKHEIQKKYEVEINRPLNSYEIKQLQTGILLNDGITSPTNVKIIKQATNKNSNFTIQITLHEGRKHQIKRMIAYFKNARVLKLTRTQIGPIKLNNLPLSHIRFLNQVEINNLKQL